MADSSSEPKDIVERLRLALKTPVWNLELDDLDNMIWDAAEEIERLREAIRNVPGLDDPWWRRRWVAAVLANSPAAT